MLRDDEDCSHVLISETRDQRNSLTDHGPFSQTLREEHINTQ